MATNYFSCQPLPSGTAPGIVTALKRAMAHADVDLGVWIRKLFFYYGDGASVVQGECGGIIRIVGDLQKEIAGYDVVVPYHASCHRCELAFKAAIGTDHVFLDLLADMLQSAALFRNNAPSRLKTLHAVALALDAAFLKLGVLHTRRWCAFAADVLRRVKRCYVIVVLGLREVHVSKAAKAAKAWGAEERRSEVWARGEAACQGTSTCAYLPHFQICQGFGEGRV